MLYVSYTATGANVVSDGLNAMDLGSSTDASASVGAAASTTPAPVAVVEDAVDQYLSKQDGMIARKRDAQ